MSSGELFRYKFRIDFEELSMKYRVVIGTAIGEGDWGNFGAPRYLGEQFAEVRDTSVNR